MRTQHPRPLFDVLFGRTTPMLTRIFVIVGLLAFPSAAMAAEVRVDYDRYNDFTRYRTFEVEIGPLVRGDGFVDDQNTLAEGRIHQAVEGALQARGLEQSGYGADIVVRVPSRDTERTAIVGSGWGPHGGAGFGYWGWGYWVPYRYWGGPYYNDLWTRRYLEGSVTIDVIERDSGKLVYRAQVIDEVGKDLNKHIAKTIDRAFEKYPVKEFAK
jgi:hypothetical protein